MNFRKCGLFACAEAPNPASRDKTGTEREKARKICFVDTDQRKIAQWEAGDVHSPFADPRRPTVGNEFS
jgi:hypothetical protein